MVQVFHGCAVVYCRRRNSLPRQLERNTTRKYGQKSVGKGTRHVQIKYSFVTDKIKNDEMRVLYCPTKEMVGDFYTKPLQGTLFKVHRNAIQGINDDDMPLYFKQYAEFIKSKDID